MLVFTKNKAYRRTKIGNKRIFLSTSTSNIAMMSDNSNKIICCTFLIWIQPVEIWITKNLNFKCCLNKSVYRTIRWYYFPWMKNGGSHLCITKQNTNTKYIPVWESFKETEQTWKSLKYKADFLNDRVTKKLEGLARLDKCCRCFYCVQLLH